MQRLPVRPAESWGHPYHAGTEPRRMTRKSRSSGDQSKRLIASILNDALATGDRVAFVKAIDDLLRVQGMTNVSQKTGLVWHDGCQGFSLLAISLFGRAATSPRPDLLFARLLRGATVKGGRRPSRKRLALDGREHSGRLARSGWQLRRSEGSSPCARRSRATNLYSADPRGSQP
jgi:hypothetical protein